MPTFHSMRRAQPEPPVDLLVVVNGFPRLSETFVLQELLELERRGVRLHVIAMRRPDEIVEQEAVSTLCAEVEYLPEISARAHRLAIGVARGALLFERRARFLHGVAEVISSPDFSRGRLDAALLLAHRIVRLGSPPVYAHFAHKPATLARFASLLAGVPYALSAHAKDIWLTPPNELARKVRDATVVLTCTTDSRDYLAAIGQGRTPVLLAYHGVDVSRLPRAHRAKARPVVLSVGRLVEKKGHATLLRAAAELRRAGVRFQLRIAGEGVEWARLQRLAHELELGGSVSFLGPLTEMEVRAEYERADVFALACRELENGDRDGIPNVILEAMAHGLPVVSTSGGGVAEAVTHDESGMLVEQDDHRAFADALRTVIEDPARRRTLGAGGRRRVAERFDRATTLPLVVDALAQAGLVVPDPETVDGEVSLRVVA